MPAFVPPPLRLFSALKRTPWQQLQDGLKVLLKGWKCEVLLLSPAAGFTSLACETRPDRLYAAPPRLEILEYVLSVALHLRLPVAGPSNLGGLWQGQKYRVVLRQSWKLYCSRYRGQRTVRIDRLKRQSHVAENAFRLEAQPADLF